MARYARTKKTLLERGVELPEMERAKPQRNIDNIDVMVQTARRLQADRVNN